MMARGNTSPSRQHKGRHYTARGNDRAHLAGAVAHQLRDMAQRPFIYIERDAETALRILDEIRAALGQSIDPESNRRLEHLASDVRTAIENGKFPNDVSGT